MSVTSGKFRQTECNHCQLAAHWGSLTRPTTRLQSGLQGAAFKLLCALLFTQRAGRPACLEQRVLGEAAALEERHRLAAADEAIAVLIGDLEPRIEEVRVHRSCHQARWCRVRDCCQQQAEPACAGCDCEAGVGASTSSTAWEWRSRHAHTPCGGQELGRFALANCLRLYERSMLHRHTHAPCQARLWR